MPCVSIYSWVLYERPPEHDCESVGGQMLQDVIDLGG